MSFQLETLVSEEQKLNESPGVVDWQRFGPGDSEAWRMYFSDCQMGNRMEANVLNHAIRRVCPFCPFVRTG